MANIENKLTNAVISYVNTRILCGLIIDSDIYIPCDSSNIPLDINRDRKVILNLC